MSDYQNYISKRLVFQQGILIIDNTKLEVNETLLKVRVDYTQDKAIGPIFNVTVESFMILNSLKVYFAISLPENKKDVKFRKDLLRGVADYEKISKGIFGNPLIKIVLDNLLKSFDFDPRLPFKAVRI